MPIIDYAAKGTIALGVLLFAIGIAYLLSWTSIRREPPRDEEDERRRGGIASTGVALAIIGMLAGGVGVLFL